MNKTVVLLYYKQSKPLRQEYYTALHCSDSPSLLPSQF